MADSPLIIKSKKFALQTKNLTKIILNVTRY